MPLSKLMNYKSINNYKKCKMKQFNVYACIPPLGTLVINELEEKAAVTALDGRTFYSAGEIETIKRENSQLFAKLSYLVSNNRAYVTNKENPVVVSGAMGELYTMSLVTFGNVCRLASNSMPCIKQNLESCTEYKDGVLNWTLVQIVNTTQTYWAYFVPKNVKMRVNRHGIDYITNDSVIKEHGKGDFIICRDYHGSPNITTAKIYNGLLFALTFNLNGWSEYTNRVDNIKVPRPDIDLCNESNPLYTIFKAKCSGIMSKLKNFYKFNTEDNRQFAVMSSYSDENIKVNFKQTTYIARYTISGKFRNYTALQQVTQNMEITNTIITFIYQASSPKAALIMVIQPICKDKKLDFLLQQCLVLPVNIYNERHELVASNENHRTQVIFDTMLQVDAENINKFWYSSSEFGDAKYITGVETFIGLKSLNCEIVVNNLANKCNECMTYVDNRPYNEALKTLLDKLGNFSANKTRLSSRTLNQYYNSWYTSYYYSVQSDLITLKIQHRGVTVLIRADDSKKRYIVRISTLGSTIQYNNGVLPQPTVPFCEYKYADVNLLVNSLQYLLGITRKLYRNAFFNARAPQYVLDALNVYTNDDNYTAMNESLRKNDFSGLSFNLYYTTMTIIDYLNSCNIHNMFMFKGVRAGGFLTQFEPIGVGTVIPYRSFLSASLSCGAANAFGEVLFRIRVKDAHGTYINDISEFRDREFEVLINAGYELVVTKVIIHGCFYDCDLRPIAGCKFDRRYANISAKDKRIYGQLLQNDIIVSNARIEPKKVKISEHHTTYDYCLTNRANNNQSLLLHVKSKNDAGNTVLKIVANDINLDGYESQSVVYEEKLPLWDIANNKQIESSVAFIANYMLEHWNVIKYNYGVIVYKQFTCIYCNLLTILQQSAYIIKDSQFVSYDSTKVNTSCSGKITINGDNDDNLAILLKLDSDGNFSVSSKSANKQISESFSVKTETAWDICNKTLKNLESEFKLDQSKRFDAAMRLACDYLNLTYCMVSKEAQAGKLTTVFRASNNKIITFIQVGDYITLGADEFMYESNLHTIAGIVSKYLKGEV